MMPGNALLRRFVRSDFTVFSSLLTDAETMLHTDGPMSVEAAGNLFDQLAGEHRNSGFDAWAIVDKKSDRFIGHAALKIISECESELIVVLDKSEWGKGIGTDVANAMILYAFGALEIERVIATIDPDHSAAIRIAEKTGMRLDRWKEDEMGRYPVYSLSREEWQSRLLENPKALVEQGYDRMSDSFSDWTSGLRNQERDKYVSALTELLRDGSDLLELGCGDGLRTTQQLAASYGVTGVDISSEQIDRARANVPEADFIHADMSSLDFEHHSFDAVIALYSLIHLPRSEHGRLLKSIAEWLRPGGILLVTMGASSVENGFEKNWLGVPMYWSHFDSDTNKRLISDAGLEIITAEEETASEHGEPVTFLWVIARRPI